MSFGHGFNGPPYPRLLDLTDHLIATVRVVTRGLEIRHFWAKSVKSSVFCDNKIVIFCLFFVIKLRWHHGFGIVYLRWHCEFAVAQIYETVLGPIHETRHRMPYCPTRLLGTRNSGWILFCTGLRWIRLHLRSFRELQFQHQTKQTGHTICNTRYTFWDFAYGFILKMQIF